MRAGKGNVSGFGANKPRQFNEFKTQSLNAQVNFFCSIRPVLSYVYFPDDVIPQPVVAQWFNAERSPAPREEGPLSGAEQALMVLRLATHQFATILRKSDLASELLPEVVGLPPKSIWRYRIIQDDNIFYQSFNNRNAISVSRSAVELFRTLWRMHILHEDFPSFDSTVQERLLHFVQELRDLTNVDMYPEGEYQNVGRRRYRVIARDATGVTFLRQGRLRPSS